MLFPALCRKLSGAGPQCLSTSLGQQRILATRHYCEQRCSEGTTEGSKAKLHRDSDQWSGFSGKRSSWQGHETQHPCAIMRNLRQDRQQNRAEVTIQQGTYPHPSYTAFFSPKQAGIHFPVSSVLLRGPNKIIHRKP